MRAARPDAGHGNSLRALVKYLDGISDADIVDLNIPTGIPLVYELDEDLNPIRHYYLGDAARVQKAMQAVASQASGNTNEDPCHLPPIKRSSCAIGQALDSPERFNFMGPNIPAAKPQAGLFQAGFMG